MDTRYGKVKWGKGQPRKLTSHAYWQQPLRWNREAEGADERPRVFPSLCDVFDMEVDPQWRDDFFDLICDTPNLDWLILTKRAAEMLAWQASHHNMPVNVWLGVSIENQEWADRRLEAFRLVNASVKFVSYEPAIGEVNWTGWEFMDWMIVGGESGPGARPFKQLWAMQTLDWCRRNGTAYFMKQKGSNSDVSRYTGKGDDPEQWPEWCRVREFPGQARLVCQ